MTTVNDRSTYSGLYSGLANNAVFAVIVSGVGLTVFESLRRVRAHTNRPDVKQSKLGGPLGSVETWEFGYFYMARSWSLHPPPILKAIPLSWIWPTLRYSEHNLPALTRSLDAVVHVRYLTASFLFALLHTCTSLPILLVIHLLFNPSDILPGSMNKASLQYLVTSDRFLWVHVVILFWLTGTWIWALIWLTRGALRYRHEVIVDSYNRAAQSTPSADMKKFRGRRFRTVMIENIPVYMRSEEALKNYFERYLAMPSLRAAFLQRGWLGWWGVIRNQLIRDLEPLPLDEEAQEHGDMPKVEQVVFARKTTELQALLEQREVLLGKLEALHVKLASNVLAAVAARLAAKEHASIESPTAEKFARKPRLIGGLQTNSSLDKLVEALGPFAKAFSQEKIQSPPLPVTGDTIWEALYRVPPELLHPYQPLIRMKPRYTGRMDVAIDYYALKLATVDKQIEEERAIDEAKREPSTTAFVTFVAPHHARKAFRFLAFNPRSPDTCFVTPAPDPSDIIWKRATRPNFRGAFLRDLLVSIGVWTFTLLWVPPVTIIVGLFSIQNIAAIFPSLRDYFNSNPAKESLVSSFLPTLLYSILVVLIPPLLRFITNHGHSAITVSKISDLVMTRYWKFLVCNAVFFFSLGVTTISSFVNVFRQPASLLTTVAQAFPAAAPFFVGWFVFETGMHVGLSISLMGFPIWMYPFHRAASTLRKRAQATKPRVYDYSYWLPTHMLVLLIMHVFAILNPLVIPFCLIYLAFEFVIVKHQARPCLCYYSNINFSNQKMQVFSRAFETNGFNINHRILRFSCDGLVFSQVIFLVLMIIIKKVGEAVLTGLLILATIMVKLYLSRKCKTAYGAADKLEADWICSTGSIMPTSQHRHELPSIASRETLPLCKRLKPLFQTKTWIYMWHAFPFEMHFPSWQLSARDPAIPSIRTQLPDDPRDSMPPCIDGPRVDNVITSLGQLAEATVHTADDNLTNEVEHPCMSTTALDAADENPIVTAHPTTAKWDDSVPYDASYENPLYTTSLDKFMWLPRNPLARLDLDDGVRIHVVLLSRPDRNWRGVGRLPRELEAQLFGDIPGTRPSGEVLLTDHDSQSYEPRSSITQEPLLKPNVRLTRDDALEEIELPPILAARVQHPEQETDIEEVEGTTLQERIRPPLSRARSFKSQASKQPSLRHTSSAENWFPGHIMREEPNELGIPPLSTVGLPETSSDGALPVIGLGGEESRISSTPGNTHGSALSSFRALANLVMREARQEKEDREKKDKKEDESRNPRSSLAQILDAHGRVNE